MKTLGFVVSGVLLLGLVPAVMAATIMMLDSPRATHADEIRVEVLLCTEAIVPLIWLASCALCIVEHRRRNRRPLTRAYVAAPYIAAGIWALGAYGCYLFA